jgi:hypothetical protein
MNDGKQRRTGLYQLTHLDIPFGDDTAGRRRNNGIGQLQCGIFHIRLTGVDDGCRGRRLFFAGIDPLSITGTWLLAASRAAWALSLSAVGLI